MWWTKFVRQGLDRGPEPRLSVAVSIANRVLGAIFGAILLSGVNHAFRRADACAVPPSRGKAAVQHKVNEA